MGHPHIILSKNNVPSTPQHVKALQQNIHVYRKHASIRLCMHEDRLPQLELFHTSKVDKQTYTYQMSAIEKCQSKVQTLLKSMTHRNDDLYISQLI
eukprot:c49338_g1_i1 orf=964-1251(-)